MDYKNQKLIYIVNSIKEEEVLEDIEKRLKNSFKKDNHNYAFREISVVPMSSKMALKGAIEGDSEAVISSGLEEVKKRISKIIKEGAVEEEKQQRYKKRIKNIIKSVERDIRNQINLHNTDIEELRKALVNIDKMVNEQSMRKEKIFEFIENEKQNIIAMARKSLSFFHSNLKEEINEAIDNYKGLDFKDYVERQLSSVIRKNMNRWVNSYYVSIHKLLEKLEKEISKGLAEYFRTRVTIKTNTSIDITHSSETDYLINIEAEDISNVTAKAGLISAGAAGVMSLIGGPILLPFISMAAFPVLQRKMLESKLKDAKISVKPEINTALNECVSRLAFEIINSITVRVQDIEQSTEYMFNQLFNSVRERIQLEIDKREQSKSSIGYEVASLEDKLQTLGRLETELVV